MSICSFSVEYFKPNYIEYVYALRSPVDWNIFYVGKTVDLKSRLMSHIQEAKSCKKDKNTNKCTYINQALEEGKIPVMSIIDETKIYTKIDKYHAFYKELFWILYYNKIGWNLTNVQSVNIRLESTDYIKYKDKRLSITYDHYYFGVNDKGEKIYDLTRIKNDGYEMPNEPESIPDIKDYYNPYSNWRFIKKNGLHESRYEGEVYSYLGRNYEDEDINEY